MNERLRSSAILFIGVLVIIFAFDAYNAHTPKENILDGSRIQVTNETIDDLFVYVSGDEARMLLDDARRRGKFKFIFPQIDLENAQHFAIENYEIVDKNGRLVTLLGIQGLPPDTTIFSNVEGTVRASAITYEKEGDQSLVIFTGEMDDSVSEFYLPYVPGSNDLSPEIEGVLEITLGAPFTKIPNGAVLEKEVFPPGWQMAVIINSLENDSGTQIEGGKMKNILTKRGKIVMIER